MSISISHVVGRQILDSRGYPTVEVDVILSDGSRGRAAVPSGASTGTREALELRDGKSGTYGGKSVMRALEHIETIIAPAVIGANPHAQRGLDHKLRELDGTPDKSHLGANAMLAVSLAIAKAAAASEHQELWQYIARLAGTTPCLPLPMMNVMNGGKHAAGSSDIQEYMIIPTGAKTIAQAVEMGATIFHSLHDVLHHADYATTVGDEGGYAPKLRHGNKEPLVLMTEAVKNAGYELGHTVHFALDIAASELYADGEYSLPNESKKLTSIDMVRWVRGLREAFPIVSIEDGLGEDDWSAWQQLMRDIGQTTQIVGDDLLVTNVTFLQQAIDTAAANAILIKPNQIGTLSETIDAVLLAQKHGFNTIMSHRSGETEDVTIAHLAVGLGTGQIKTGSLSRSERIAKYNELMRIELANPHLKLARPFGGVS